VDHAYDLSQCVLTALDWFKDEPLAGMHTIHVAESSNGWFRPDGPDQVLYPAKRSKFTLRVPQHRSQDAQKLVGQRFDVAGHELNIEKVMVRELSKITTLFSRYVVTEGTSSENEFMEKSLIALRSLGISPKKMICGIENRLTTPDGKLSTRSMMLADLQVSESFLLQERGLGTHRTMGCGLFIPHKDINQIREDQG
jgi:CRISPR-associated protein Cas6